MQDQYLQRNIQDNLKILLSEFPAVAILGPRQSGKSTLAGHLLQEFQNTLYLDLEKLSDARKLTEPELFLDLHQDKLVCMDEIQRVPEIFPVLRGIIDERGRNGQFLILGSASRDFIRQTSETLAGRIAYAELTPFLFSEILSQEGRNERALQKFWIRGGFPRSFLASGDESSSRWREQFVRTFLERDVPRLGSPIPSEIIGRLWKMCAHNHGQLLNSSRLGEAVGVSHTTVRSYIGLLSQTFMIRMLPPLDVNLKKRLVKSPKCYIRDSGILHTLLEIDDWDDLIGHPIYGSSWEGLALENILSYLPDWNSTFYRTSAGAELDCVLTKGKRRVGVEFKASLNPQVSRGFWNTLSDLELKEARIIAPVKEGYPIHKQVRVTSIIEFLSEIKSISA